MGKKERRYKQAYIPRTAEGVEQRPGFALLGKDDATCSHRKGYRRGS